MRRSKTENEIRQRSDKGKAVLKANILSGTSALCALKINSTFNKSITENKAQM